MIKNILVPVDYSKASINALDTAVSIAAGNNAAIHLLHVKDVVPGAEEHYPKENYKKVFDAMAGRIMIEYGVPSKIIFTEGIVGHTIINTVLENNIDLVVMGSYGLSGPGDILIGSNSYYVIKRSPSPVLLIPEGAKRTEFNKILFPVRPTLFTLRLYSFIGDFIKQNKKASFVQIFGISAVRFKTGMQRLYSVIQAIKDKYINGKVEVSVKSSEDINIAESVLNEAHEIEADLIIISPGVDLASEPFFVGPFSQKIIYQSKVPILSIIKMNDN